MIFSHDFAADLAAIDWFSPEPFALVRYGDGERRIITGLPMKVHDGGCDWHNPGPDFVAALRSSLLFEDHDYFLGVSCPCCDPNGHEFYLNAIPPHRHGHMTFANLFVNGNYETFIARFTEAPASSIGWVGPPPRAAGGIPSQLFPIHFVGRNLVNDPAWDRKLDRIVDKMIHEAPPGPIFVAAGPCAKIIIHRYWQKNKDCDDRPQTVIDVGSVFDVRTFGVPTRGYHTDSATRTQICHWS